MFGIHRQAHMTVKDSGTNGKIDNNGLKIVVIKLTVTGENDATYPAKFTLNGGTLQDSCDEVDGYAPICGHGGRHNTEVTINDGKVISKKHYGIFQAQDGKLTVNGGHIEGVTGIEVRAGSLTVNGGTIVGTGKTLSVVPSASGGTTEGAGIAVAQHNTKKDIKVIINNGTVKGYVALHESNPQNNTEIDKVSLEVNNGTFEAINGGKDAVVSENKDNFVKGGTFSSDVSDYVVEDVETVKDEDGTIFVGKLHTITVLEVKNGKVVSDKVNAIKGQKVTLIVDAEEGYKVKALKATTKAGEVKVSNNAFVMPDEDVTITAEFEKVVENNEEEKINSEKDEEPKMGMEVSVITILSIVAIVTLAGYVVTKK